MAARACDPDKGLHAAVPGSTAEVYNSAGSGAAQGVMNAVIPPFGTFRLALLKDSSETTEAGRWRRLYSHSLIPCGRRSLVVARGDEAP